MKRPLAYITAAWCGSDHENTKLAAQYCRTVYEAGFSPICPTLYQPLFLNDAVPEEHKSGIDMGRDLLRRSHVLVVCGHTVTEAMKNDIAVAQRLGITATTLEGILTVKGQGADKMTALRLGSLFDGIGVFPLAAVRCGIVPTWASEIEKSAYLHHETPFSRYGAFRGCDKAGRRRHSACPHHHLWLTVSKSLARQPQGACGRKVQPVFSSHPHYP